jgi:hypothetical protein
MRDIEEAFFAFCEIYRYGERVVRVNPGYATEAAKRKRKEDGGNWRRGGRNGR